MKYKKIIISVSVFTAAAAIAVTMAYRSVREEEKKREIASAQQEESVEIYRPVVTTEPESTPEATVQPIYYYLQSEENMLNLYEINGESKKLVKSVEVNLQMFPQEDRELLKNGIMALTLEEGIEIIENFVS